MVTSESSVLLRSGLAQLAIQASEDQIQAIEQYLELLFKWNKTHNLTAINSLQQAIELHVLDSLSVLPYITGPRILDVGSGGGLPGMLLAILKPQCEFVSVDARDKKIQFQSLAAGQLGLENFTAVHSRVEAFSDTELFDQIIARAFSSLANFTSLTQHLLARDGEWLAMKGQYPEEELADMDPQIVKLVQTTELQIPGNNATRHLLHLKNA